MRTVPITVRVPPDVKTTLEARAAAAVETTSAYAGRILTRAARRPTNKKAASD